MNGGTTARGNQHGGAGVPISLLLVLAVQNAVPPFATDTYSPAFPQLTDDLGTSSALVGLTLTTFFIGMAVGQIVGGAVSDQRGRRAPLLMGAVLMTLGGVVCALAPGIWVLNLGRIVQGFGGGVASAVARAVLVDVAHGNALARAMSLLMAIGGLAPMIAPVVGGTIVTHSTWRTVFWFLTAFGVVMIVTAWVRVPESLPPELRHTGGLRQFTSGIGRVLRRRLFVGHMLTSAFSGFCMFAYISDSSYVLQEMKGLSPLAYSLFFAGNAGIQVMLTLLNARLVGWARPLRLVRFGLSVAAVGVVILTLSVLAWGMPLLVLCTGFVLLLAGQAFVFGNSSALALGASRGDAGTASAVQGLVQSTAMAVAAPLASSGGGSTAVPMVAVMVLGMSAAWVFHLLVSRWTVLEEA